VTLPDPAAEKKEARERVAKILALGLIWGVGVLALLVG
jgi:hypothetical protein